MEVSGCTEVSVVSRFRVTQNMQHHERTVSLNLAQTHYCQVSGKQLLSSKTVKWWVLIMSSWLLLEITYNTWTIPCHIIHIYFSSTTWFNKQDSWTMQFTDCNQSAQLQTRLKGFKRHPGIHHKNQQQWFGAETLRVTSDTSIFLKIPSGNLTYEHGPVECSLFFQS